MKLYFSIFNRAAKVELRIILCDTRCHYGFMRNI